jgi:hypothetical protein
VREKQDLGFVDVADAADDGLVHHGLADRRRVVDPETAEYLGFVERVGQQIRTEPAERKERGRTGASPFLSRSA